MKSRSRFVKIFATTVVTTLLATGCGRSPLLHHLDATPAFNPTVVSENSPGTTGESGQPGAPTCALRFAKSGLCVGFKWGSTPATDEEMSATLTLTNDQGQATDAPSDLAMQLWMPSMGHGSSPVRVTRTELGSYSATGISFIMPGQWEVRIQLKTGREVTEQATFNVKL